MAPIQLSIEQARRIALAAQGFATPRPTGRVDRRHVRSILNRIGLLQIDSVNVLARSEELVVFSRLGPHDRSLVRKMDADGELFEYWAHEASLMPTAMEPLFRYQKDRALLGDDPSVWSGLRNLHLERPDLVENVFKQILEHGPIPASALSSESESNREHWGWNWNEAKLAVENLFWTGRVVSRRRSSTFAREYDLPERCFPAEILATPPPTQAEALRELVRRSASAHGIGTAKCLADYFRLAPAVVRPILDRLVEEGELLPANIEGWTDRAYLCASARKPRTIAARALLSPFDPVIWQRTRAEQLFGFRYRIEIYVPKAKRQFGYYVLPFLLGDALVARVDLKSDRQRGVLLVQAAWAEEGVDTALVARELAAELASMAEWLGLTQGIEVRETGDLHAQLSSAIP